MSLCYYTITPQPEKSPVAFIFRLFAEKNDEPTILETKNFPILNPNDIQRAYDEADLYGRLSCAVLMSGVQS